jgi:long-chain acyl-CoA synthetase
MLLSNSLVELACIGGRGQPQPHAILQLSEADKKKAAEGNDSRAEIAKKLEVYLEKTVNSSLDGHEKLDFIAIVADDWLPENGFLTPTQKIKRAKIEEEYSSEVEGWYGQKEKVIWYGW